jgi:hypothetical protein
MAFGPGRYDDVCQCVLEETGGEIAIVAVVNGKRGHGVSHKAITGSSIDLAEMLMTQARVFREAADELQAQARRMKQQKRGN